MNVPEPRTEAGKRLDLAWPGSHIDRLDWRDRILAIEAEAAAQGGLREALVTLHGAFTAVAPQFHSSGCDVETCYVQAALAAQPTAELVA